MEHVTKYEMAAFTALINMIKVNYHEKTEVYKTLLAVLGDFDPDESSSKEKTEHYIQLLLREDKDLIDCLLSFLPKPVTTSKPSNQKQEPAIKLHIKTKKKKKHRRYHSVKQSCIVDSILTTGSGDVDNEKNRKLNSTSPCSENHDAEKIQNSDNEAPSVKQVNTTILDPTSFHAVMTEIKPCSVTCTSPHSHNTAPTSTKATAPVCTVVPAKVADSSTQEESHITISSCHNAINEQVSNTTVTTGNQGMTLQALTEVPLQQPLLTHACTIGENASTHVYKTAPIESQMVLSCSDNSGNIMTKDQLSQRLSKAPEFPCFIYNQQNSFKPPFIQKLQCNNNGISPVRDKFSLPVNSNIPVKVADSKNLLLHRHDSLGNSTSSRQSPDILSVITCDTPCTISQTLNENYQLQSTITSHQQMPRPELTREINPVVQWTAKYDQHSTMKQYHQLPVQAIDRIVPGLPSNIIGGRCSTVPTNLLNPKIAPYQHLPLSMPQSVHQTVPLRSAHPSAPQPMYQIPPAHIYLGTASNLSSFPYTRQIILPDNPNICIQKLPVNKTETRPLNLVTNQNRMIPTNQVQGNLSVDTEDKNLQITALNYVKAPLVALATENKVKDDRYCENNDFSQFIIGQKPNVKIPLEVSHPMNVNNNAAVKIPLEVSHPLNVNNNSEINQVCVGELDTSCVTTKTTKPRKLTMTPNQGVRKKLRLIPYKQDIKENRTSPEY